MIDDGDVDTLLRNRLRRLTALHLGTNTLTDAACAMLARWPHPPLIELRLPDNRLSPEGVRQLADSAHGDTLEGLDLKGNRLALVDLARRGREWPRLRRLALDDALVADRGRAAQWLRPMPRLERLSLASTAWSPELAGWLSSGSLPRLRRLNLQRTGLQPEDLTSLLQHGMGGAALCRLNLSRNPLGEDGVRALLRFAGSPCLAQLVELNLERTQIGEASYRALCEWPAASPLVRLSLVDNAAMSGGVQDRLRVRFGIGLRCD
jgi:Ran GTPase-activating protein (RanGAP) involved in mRNA processing and transport